VQPNRVQKLKSYARFRERLDRRKTGNRRQGSSNGRQRLPNYRACGLIPLKDAANVRIEWRRDVREEFKACERRTSWRGCYGLTNGVNS
jgi:hypothetical protein